MLNEKDSNEDITTEELKSVLENSGDLIPKKISRHVNQHP